MRNSLFANSAREEMSQNDSTSFILHEDWFKNADPRVKDWFLMSSVWPQTFIVLSYIYFVTKLGPRLMENRKAFDLKNAMVFYNFSITALSLYMIYEFLMSGWANGYSFRCEIVDYSNSPMALRMASVCWLYWFSKIIEMLDTIFFVLRKKSSQVTFLHVFHHSIMPFTWWFAVKFSPGGSGTFHGLVNCGVHVVMYSYYGLAALGPAYQQYLWWKKYLTKIQLVQFVVVAIHVIQVLFNDCPYQYPIFLYIILLYAVVFTVLFLNFFFHAYIKGERLPTLTHGQKDKATRIHKCVHNDSWSHGRRICKKDD